MAYKFYTADVFTDKIFGGNQLAVFPYADGLNSQQMQKVAAEFNLSEVVFVFAPRKPEYHRRLRIFTPKTELPFAGHPTLGAAYILTAIKDIPLINDFRTIVFEEGVGEVIVNVSGSNGVPLYSELTAAQLPQFGPEPPPQSALAAMLSLNVSDLLTGDNSPQAVSCGLPFLFIPLRNRDAVSRVKLNRQHWEELLASYWAPQVYVFADEPNLQVSDLQARMFAPGLGIEEDPATGAAATALAGYLGTRNQLTDATLTWLVEQGIEMGRPSLLKVQADKKNGRIMAIRVGGASVLVGEGTIEIPKIKG